MFDSVISGPVAKFGPKVTFDLDKVGATVVSSASLRTVPGWELDIIEGLVHTLEAYVLTEHRVVGMKTVTLHEEVQFSCPTSWWDHYRRDRQRTHRHHRIRGKFWCWVNGRWPVQYTHQTRTVHKTEQVKFNSDLRYPQAGQSVRPEQFGRPVIFEHFS